MIAALDENEPAMGGEANGLSLHSFEDDLHTAVVSEEEQLKTASEEEEAEQVHEQGLRMSSLTLPARILARKRPRSLTLTAKGLAQRGSLTLMKALVLVEKVCTPRVKRAHKKSHPPVM